VFAQLTWRESLRDIEACLNARLEHRYHLGCAARPNAAPWPTRWPPATGASSPIWPNTSSACWWTPIRPACAQPDGPKLPARLPNCNLCPCLPPSPMSPPRAGNLHYTSCRDVGRFAGIKPCG
jgi:hypothetical protein